MFSLDTTTNLLSLYIHSNSYTRSDIIHTISAQFHIMTREAVEAIAGTARRERHGVAAERMEGLALPLCVVCLGVQLRPQRERLVSAQTRREIAIVWFPA